MSGMNTIYDPVNKEIGGPVEIKSEDPEVMTLQAMIRGIDHFKNRSLSMDHFKVLMAVELFIKLSSGRTFPRVKEIAHLSRLRPADFDGVLRDLVELKYLHEVFPQFGAMTMRYKLGSMGGTMLRRMLDRQAKKRGKKCEAEQS